MKRTEEIFQQVKTYLEGADSFKGVDEGPIRIYATALADWEQLTAEIEEEGYQVQDRDDLPRKNPKLMAQRQAAELVHKYAQLLGITAYGRKRASLTPKEAKKKLTGAAALRPIVRNRKTS